MTTLPPFQSSTLDASIEALRAHLQAKLHKPLRLKDLEAHTHYSSRSLQYAFRRQLGCSPMQWIHDQRLARAMALLQSHGRQISIQAVAKACGYRHTGQLRVLFKRRYGVSPSKIQRDLPFHG